MAMMGDENDDKDVSTQSNGKAPWRLNILQLSI